MMYRYTFMDKDMKEKKKREYPAKKEFVYT